ncbi:MAG: hypothetical protein L0G23_09605, partial [Ruaniaceae bacterium]|nr:hypothetical protein [Ruaniaceae bacterium]
MLTIPSNAERFPNWRNCVEQLLVMLSFSSDRSAVGFIGSLLAWIGFRKAQGGLGGETRGD